MISYWKKIIKLINFLSVDYDLKVKKKRVDYHTGHIYCSLIPLYSIFYSAFQIRSNSNGYGKYFELCVGSMHCIYFQGKLKEVWIPNPFTELDLITDEVRDKNVLISSGFGLSLIGLAAKYLSIKDLPL